MIIGFFHLGAIVENLDKSLKFYGEKLGIKDIRSQISDQPYLAKVTGVADAKLKIGFMRLEGDAFPLEAIEYINPKGTQVGGGLEIVGALHYCWQVENLPDLFAQLKKEGVTFLTEPHLIGHGIWHDWSGAFMLDPDGRILELIEPPGQNVDAGRLVRIHHIGITCSDINRMKDLLCSQLGLTDVDQISKGSAYFRHISSKIQFGLDVAYLHIPGSEMNIELLQFHTTITPSIKGRPNSIGSGHLCFLVDEIEKDYEILDRAGVQFVGPPVQVTAGINIGGYAIYFSGPDNIWFELFQKPKPPL